MDPTSRSEGSDHAWVEFTTRALVIDRAIGTRVRVGLLPADAGYIGERKVAPVGGPAMNLLLAPPARPEQLDIVFGFSLDLASPS